MKEDYAFSTINKKINSLKVYNDFLRTKGVVDESFIQLKRDRIKIVAGSEDSVDALSEEQVEKLLFYVENRNKVSTRNKLIVYLLLYTGVRVCELITATSGGFDGKYVVKTVADKVRPTFKEVTYDAIGNATFYFSEPLDASTANIANALNVSGSVVISAGDITIADDKKSFTIALPEAMTTNTNYNFTFTGLKDFAGNLLSPNPLTVSVVKSNVETVKSTVTSVESAGVGKLKVTFSEKVQTAGATIKVGNSTATSVATLDESKTVLTFNDVALSAGVQNVLISGVKDLAGNTMESITRLIEIKADTTAPAFVSQELKKLEVISS